MTDDQKYDVCVIGGLGHVGLPLSILLAERGKKVIIYDLYEKSIDKVSSGEMPFGEAPGAEESLKKVLNKTLFITSDKNVISSSKMLVVVIGTPADRHLNPEFTVFKNFLESIIDLIHDDHHIILRSTLFPGTTESIKKFLESKGKNTKVSFCPERVAQGKAMEELLTLPQIISSFDENSRKEAEEFFSVLTDQIIFLTPIEAELAKLFCNIWRYILFSISNQFYQISVENNVDFYKIFEAITHEYPRLDGLKKAGFAAGPCLFKDTAHMISFTGNTFFLGNASMMVNEGLPNFILQQLKVKYDIKTNVVGILGMAFKADSDDSRDSLAYKLKNMAEMEAKEVLCSDEYIKSDDLVPSEELIARSDIIIVGAPHSRYKELEIPGDKILVDIWNFFGRGGLF